MTIQGFWGWPYLASFPLNIPKPRMDKAGNHELLERRGLWVSSEKGAVSMALGIRGWAAAVNNRMLTAWDV